MLNKKDFDIADIESVSASEITDNKDLITMEENLKYEIIIKEEEIEINRLYIKARVFQEQNKLLEAEKCFLKAKEKYEYLDMLSRITFLKNHIEDERKFKILGFLSIINYKMGNFKKSKKYYIGINRIIQKSKINFYNSDCDSNCLLELLARIQHQNGDYVKAEYNFNKLLTKIKKYTTNALRTYSTLSSIKKNLGDQMQNLEIKNMYYNEALKFQDNVYEIAKKLNYNCFDISIIYSNQGALYYKLNNLKVAEQYFQSSLEYNPNNRETKNNYLFLLEKKFNEYNKKYVNSYNYNKKIIKMQKEITKTVQIFNLL